MQHKQFNFMRQGTKAALVILPLFGISPALAGSIVQPSKPDPLLDSGPTVACAAGVDYAPGIDVNGQPVVPADVAARRVPIPDSIAIPLTRQRVQAAGPTKNSGRGQAAGTPDNASNRDSTYVALDGRKLEPLLNPPPCGAVY